MTPLREAAQALFDYEDNREAALAGFPDWPRHFDALRAALSQPDPDRYAEGYRAGIEAAANYCGDANDAAQRGAFRSRYRIAEEIRALPVPPAPPEAQPAESKRACADCRFKHTHATQEPCRSCYSITGHPRWTPAPVNPEETR